MASFINQHPLFGLPLRAPCSDEDPGEVELERVNLQADQQERVPHHTYGVALVGTEK